MKKYLAVLFVSVLFVSCNITGEEIGRLPINKLSTSEQNVFPKQVTLNLKKGDEISIWSEMDLEYSGEIQCGFMIRISKDKKPYRELEIDPFVKNITMNEYTTSVNDNTKTSFTGKNEEFKAEEDGAYTFEGIFRASDNATLKVNKAEVVFKK